MRKYSVKVYYSWPNRGEIFFREHFVMANSAIGAKEAIWMTLSRDETDFVIDITAFPV